MLVQPGKWVKDVLLGNEMMPQEADAVSPQIL